MTLPLLIQKDINEMMIALIRNALVNAQHFPVIKGQVERDCTIGFENDDKITISFGLDKYEDIYDRLLDNQVYSMRLLDGGLVQISYSFASAKMTRHRLAYYPNPHVGRDEDSYCDCEESESIALMLQRRNVVPFPIRFDFNIDEMLFVPIEHPRSHLTLGGFECCRIPISSPIPPIAFMRFILRNFYSLPGVLSTDILPSSSVSDLPRTIDPLEQRELYMDLALVKNESDFDDRH